jgi:hypothetical protein
MHLRIHRSYYDERTETRGCGEVPATKGDKVQRVLRWCKVLHAGRLIDH